MPDQRDPQTYAVIGAAMEVHNTLGQGFLENVYQEALAVDLARADISFSRECALPIHYKSTILPCYYKADLICYGTILVELKALARLSTSDDAQVLNYMKVSGLTKALLINFGAPKLEYRRFVI